MTRQYEDLEFGRLTQHTTCSEDCVNCFVLITDIALECRGEKSDHFGHIISSAHPTCSYIEER
jgi:hypothetical protein